ncbi:hypothetical protein RUND412_006794 [Rhizina undulata]
MVRAGGQASKKVGARIIAVQDNINTKDPRKLEKPDRPKSKYSPSPQILACVGVKWRNRIISKLLKTISLGNLLLWAKNTLKWKNMKAKKANKAKGLEEDPLTQFKVLTAMILQGQLTLEYIATYRLFCSVMFRPFPTPQCCRFLLHHFFPFSTEVALHLGFSSIIHTPQVHAKVTKGAGEGHCIAVAHDLYSEFPLPLPDVVVDELEHYHVVNVDARYPLTT